MNDAAIPEGIAPDARTSPSLGRIALGLLLGGVIGAATLSLLAWGVYALSRPEEGAFGPRSMFAMLAALSSMAIFTLTLAPATVFVLLRLRLRSWPAFALGGAAAGCILLALTGMITEDAGDPIAFAALGLLGAMHLTISRAAAGIRRAPPDPDLALRRPAPRLTDD